jgi:PhnB protein
MAGTEITPYLFFSGRCEEAIEFYRKGLGAEVEFLMYHKQSPTPHAVPLQPGFEDKVMHVSLRIGGALLMASDGCDDKSHFDGFRIGLSLPTIADAHRAFDALADGGTIQMPLAETFHSPCFGMVTDRFGVGWMISGENKQ